jgi:hypothetical protein
LLADPRLLNQPSVVRDEVESLLKREMQMVRRTSNPQRRKRTPPRELHVFDFDGTLFRSPPSPVPDKRWYTKYESLDVPNVPRVPDASWWIEPVVLDAQRSIADPEVHAIVLTGRVDKPDLRYRVAELLDSAGLDFDDVFLNDLGGRTQTFKLKRIGSLLRKYPTIDDVYIWEDRGNHLDFFIDRLNQAGFFAEGYLIEAASKPPGTVG